MDSVEGILHKPQDFDPTKYPVIFNYYERRSECLNVFRMPELSWHNVNIPWFVSRGYLVFEPDFYYKTGKTYQSIVDAVNTAAKNCPVFLMWIYPAWGRRAELWRLCNQRDRHRTPPFSKLPARWRGPYRYHQ